MAAALLDIPIRSLYQPHPIVFNDDLKQTLAVQKAICLPIASSTAGVKESVTKLDGVTVAEAKDLPHKPAACLHNSEAGY